MSKTYLYSEELPLQCIPDPLKMAINYQLSTINNNKIEMYEMEILFKKGETMKSALGNLEKALEGFCEECEDIIEIICKDDSSKRRN